MSEVIKMGNAIIHISGRCSSWGRDWNRHMYNGTEDCLRCGMNREEQFNEDKAVGLVSGSYKPNTGKPTPARKHTSKKIMWCALGEEGIEFADPSKLNVKKWIKVMTEDDNIGEDYYEITSMTKSELDALPEN